MTSPSVLLGQSLIVEMILDGSGVPTNWTDVSAYLTDGVQISRGRSRETDQFTGGTAVFTLRNESRKFDPLNSSSPYYPQIVPRIRVRVLFASALIFTGFLDDIQVNYEQPKFSTVTFTAIDGLGLLAATMLQSKSVSDQSPGARLATILADSHVGYPDSTNVVGLSQTVVGFTGLNTPYGVALDSQGNLYVTDSSNNRIKKMTPGGVESIFPTTGLSPGFSNPTGIFCDTNTDHLYVADTNNNRVVIWSGSSWGGSGVTGLSSPTGVWYDANSSTLYVTDNGHGTVQQYVSGTQSEFHHLASMVSPSAVMKDGSGIVYVSDPGHSAPRVVYWNGSWNTLTITGLSSPGGLAAVGVGSEIYVVDSGNNRAYHYLSGQATMPFSGLNTPEGIVADSFGTTYIADAANNRVVTIWDGAYTLGTDTLDQISALDHLNTCALSCYSYLYVDAYGVLQFRSRMPANTASVCTLTDAGGAIKYQSVSLLSSTILLFTEVTGVSSATDAAGVRQTSSANTTKYYHKVYQLPALNNKNDADVQNLCQYIVGLYNQAEVRFDTLTVQLESASTGNQTILAGLELTDIVHVVLTPPGGGSAIALDQIVEGMTFDLNASAGTYGLTLNLGSIGA